METSYLDLEEHEGWSRFLIQWFKSGSSSPSCTDGPAPSAHDDDHSRKRQGGATKGWALILWDQCLWKTYSQIQGYLLVNSGGFKKYIIYRQRLCYSQELLHRSTLEGTPGIFSAKLLIYSLQIPSAWEKAVDVTRWRKIHLAEKMFPLFHYFWELFRRHTLPGVQSFW